MEGIMENNKLTVLWVTRDKEAALHMVFMYAKNAKIQGWWEEVEVIIWGPSAQLTAIDEDIQLEIQMAKHAGVEVRACATCASRYGVEAELINQGIEVIGMGIPLTEALKAGNKILSI